MPKPRTWVIIVLSGIFGIALFGCFLSAVIGVLKGGHEAELIDYKKVTNHRCNNCRQIFVAETTDAKMKRGELNGKKFVVEYRDTLCAPCILKLAPVAERLFKEGQKAYYAKDYDTATEKLDSSAAIGCGKAEPWLDKVAARLTEIEKAKFEKGQAEERKTYALLLRAHFLDVGEDIEVHVRGKGNKELRLKYVLFTSVWIWNFQKGDLIEEIRAKGFKTVYFTDGYYSSWHLDL